MSEGKRAGDGFCVKGTGGDFRGRVGRIEDWDNGV